MFLLSTSNIVFFFLLQWGWVNHSTVIRTVKKMVRSWMSWIGLLGFLVLKILVLPLLLVEPTDLTLLKKQGVLEESFIEVQHQPFLATPCISIQTFQLNCVIRYTWIFCIFPWTNEPGSSDTFSSLGLPNTIWGLSWKL